MQSAANACFRSRLVTVTGISTRKRELRRVVLGVDISIEILLSSGVCFRAGNVPSNILTERGSMDRLEKAHAHDGSNRARAQRGCGLALLRWLDIRESIRPIRKVRVFNSGRLESAAGRWLCR